MESNSSRSPEGESYKNKKEKGSQNRVKHQLLLILDIKSIDFSIISKNEEALSVQNHYEEQKPGVIPWRVVATVTNHKLHDLQNEATLSITSSFTQKREEEKSGDTTKLQYPQSPYVMSTDLSYICCLYGSFQEQLVHPLFI